MLKKLFNKQTSRQIIHMSKRFEGSYPWYPHPGDTFPRDNLRVLDDYLDESEIITRMMWVIHCYKTWDLEKLKWDVSLEEQGIDSLESTALLTSIEHEFHTVFEDRVFEKFNTLNEVKDFLA